MKFHRVLLRIVLLVVTFCGAAWAQTRLHHGTVKDPSGAAVAGATVVVTSPERGINRKRHQLHGRIQRVCVARRLV